MKKKKPQKKTATRTRLQAGKADPIGHFAAGLIWVARLEPSRKQGEWLELFVNAWYAGPEAGTVLNITDAEPLCRCSEARSSCRRSIASRAERSAGMTC